jgi:hypothetical protein
VRDRFVPLFHEHDASLVVSGHQHAYSRGFLPTSLAPVFFSAPSSESVDPETMRAARRAVIEDSHDDDERGVTYAIIGGAGGTLDYERVEDWGWMEASITGRHHFVSISLELDVVPENGGSDTSDVPDEWHRRRRRRRRGPGGCASGQLKRDRLYWRAWDLNGREMDKFMLEAETCN